MLLGAKVDDLLRSAGQPRKRPGRLWRYCVRGTRNAKAKVVAVIGGGERVALVGSTARPHRARHSLRRTRAYGKGVRVKRAGRKARFVYGVRRGRIRWVAVATPRASKTPKRLRKTLKVAGLR